MDSILHATFINCNHDVYPQGVYMPDNADMDTDYDRLLKAAEELKGWTTPSEVALNLTRCGYEVTTQMMTNWKSRGVSKEGRLNASRIIGCRPHWIESGNGPMRDRDDPSLPGSLPIIEWDDPSDLPQDEFVIVPRYDLHVAAGNGHVVYDELELKQGKAYRTDYMRAEGLYRKNLLCLYARGDSMEPSICSGDTLLVDRSQTHIQDRGVYVLRYGDEIRVKRLYRRPDGGLRIVSDNAAHFPEEVITAAEMEHIEIIGRVVERSGRM